MGMLFELKGISKSFGKNQVLNNLNFKVNEGEKIAILGPNGGGKSTLVNIISGFSSYDHGKITYGKNQKQSDFVKDLGIQFQNSKFPDNYRINEVIDICFEINYNVSYKNYKKWKKEVRNIEKEELVKLFNLDEKLNYKLRTLSGGEAQRLNVLISLISRPPVLILDEVSSGLDIKAQTELLNYINDFVSKNKITLIIISHLIHEIKTLAEEIYFLEDGQIKYFKNIKKIDINTLKKSLDDHFVNKPKRGKK